MQDSTPRRNAGHFRKGSDSRRHRHTATCGHQLYKFTPEDCSVGFFVALSVWGVSIGQKLHASGKWPGYRHAR